MNSSIVPKKRAASKGIRIRSAVERKLAKDIKHKNIEFRKLLAQLAKRANQKVATTTTTTKKSNNTKQNNYASLENIAKAINALEKLKTKQVNQRNNTNSVATPRARNTSGTPFKPAQRNNNSTGPRKSSRVRRAPVRYSNTMF
jgi:septal ring factor EnvC (AmiA/AmiB activator)